MDFKKNILSLKSFWKNFSRLRKPTFAWWSRTPGGVARPPVASGGGGGALATGSGPRPHCWWVRGSDEALLHVGAEQEGVDQPRLDQLLLVGRVDAVGAAGRQPPQRRLQDTQTVRTLGRGAGRSGGHLDPRTPEPRDLEHRDTDQRPRLQN